MLTIAGHATAGTGWIPVGCTLSAQPAPLSAVSSAPTILMCAPAAMHGIGSMALTARVAVMFCARDAHPTPAHAQSATTTIVSPQPPPASDAPTSTAEAATLPQLSALSAMMATVCRPTTPASHALILTVRGVGEEPAAARPVWMDMVCGVERV